MTVSIAIVVVVDIALLCVTASSEVCSDTDRAESDSSSAMVQAKSAREQIFDEALNISGTADASLYTELDDSWAFNHCANKSLVHASAPVQHRKPVMFIHLHKAAGTSVCCEARRHERVISPSNNCNSIDGVRPSGTGDDWNLWREHPDRPSWTTCEHRRARMKDQRLTWRSIEREFVDGDFCPEDFLYFTIVREPMSLLGSVLNFPQDRRRLDEFPMEHIVDCIKNQLPSCTALSHTVSWSNYWKIFDNFMVRTLGGYETMMVPPGRINSSHFERAKNVLQKFDLVIVLERLAEQKSRDAMDHFIGWHLDPKVRMNNRKGPRARPDSARLTQLRDINAWDIALYNLADEWHNKLQL